MALGRVALLRTFLVLSALALLQAAEHPGSSGAGSNRCSSVLVAGGSAAGCTAGEQCAAEEAETEHPLSIQQLQKMRVKQLRELLRQRSGASLV